MSIPRYSCVLDGATPFEYEADSDGNPIQFLNANPVSEHKVIAPSSVEAAIVPEEWWINIGPFFDRFGAHKHAILASADPDVRAVILDCSVRKFIDLKGRRADILQAIGLLQFKGFAVDPVAILDVKPNEKEVYQ